VLFSLRSSQPFLPLRRKGRESWDQMRAPRRVWGSADGMACVIEPRWLDAWLVE